MIYLDSSALVKRYVEETGSAEVDRLVADAPHVATSRLAYPEILSALHRKARLRELTAKKLDDALSALEADWESLIILEFPDALRPLLRKAIRRHPIRGADAIHLVSAMWLRSELKSDLLFACSDTRLLDAARAEKLIPFNPVASVGG